MSAPGTPQLRREVQSPTVSAEWLWTFLLVKASLVALAMGGLALLSR